MGARVNACERENERERQRKCVGVSVRVCVLEWIRV